MRASILLAALSTTAAACAVSPDVTPLPVDASQEPIDAAQPPPIDASGPRPDGRPGDIDAQSPFDAGPVERQLGWPEPFLGSRVLLPANSLFVFRLPAIDEPVTLHVWGAIGTASTDIPVRMALYRDAAGQPGDLVNWTESWPISNGQQSGTGALLEPGTYWLGINGSDDVEIGEDPAQPIDSCARAHSFTAPFDSNFGTAGSCMPRSAPNLYIVVRDSN